MGVAPGAVRALPMGAESETHAWTAYGGRWRVVHVRYPRRFPPGWGRSPAAAIALGLAFVVPAAFVVYGLWSLITGAGDDLNRLFEGGGAALAALVALVVAVAPLAALAYGAAMFWSGASDLGKRIALEGQVLRRKEVHNNDDSGTVAVYLAVYNGNGGEVRALRCKPTVASGVHAGSVVRTTITPHLAHVYSVERVPG
jgi:hypothetical protein